MILHTMLDIMMNMYKSIWPCPDSKYMGFDALLNTNQSKYIGSLIRICP